MRRLTGTVTVQFDYRLEREDGDLTVEVVGEWDRDHGAVDLVEVRDMTKRLVHLTAAEEDALIDELRERAACWDDGAAEDAAEHRREMREGR